MSGEPITATGTGAGKLFVVGEHAVVTAGEPAVLVAVDRGVRAKATVAQRQGSIHSPGSTLPRVAWRHERDAPTITGTHPYRHALAAMSTVERLRSERGLREAHYDLVFDSDLDDETGGAKLGLGSSAAVTVATVRALSNLYGLALDDRSVFRLAMLATIAVSPRASGGDLAAATTGGWILYRSPDREGLARALTATGSVAGVLDDEECWHGSELRPLPAPSSLRLVVGWTGAPASTDALVASVAQAEADAARRAFVESSRPVVLGVADGLRSGDDAAVQRGIRDARALLQRLGAATGVEIETPLLTTLCDVAEARGAAAKPSGAGGGDCGIALAHSGVDARALGEQWRAVGIRPLDLSVAAGGTPARKATNV